MTGAKGARRYGNVLTGMACVALAVAPAIVDSGNLRLIMEILLTFAIAQAFNLLGGYGGLLSFGHNVFVGIGAYALFLLTDWTGVSPFLGVFVSGAACGLFALIVAPMLFRLRDAYFSIGMWVLADAVKVAIGQWPPSGMSNGLTLQLSDSVQNDWFIPIAYWMAATLTMGSFILTVAMLRARLGLGLMAIRDNEDAAAGIGIDVWRSRLIAFVLSGVICGAAGAIYYMTVLFIDPNSAFDIDWLVRALFIVVVGGIGTIEGPFVGTAIYFLLRQAFSDAGAWYLILMGVVAIVVMLFAPGGVWGVLHARFGFELFPIRRQPPDPEPETAGRGLRRAPDGGA